MTTNGKAPTGFISGGREVGNMSDRDKVFEYKGKIYVRPIGRGVCLKEGDYEGTWAQLEKELPEGDFYMEVVVYKRDEG